MPNIQPPTNVYSTMRDMHWSPKEKTIARRAFDRALHQELGATIQEAKQMAERIDKCILRLNSERAHKIKYQSCRVMLPSQGKERRVVLNR